MFFFYVFHFFCFLACFPESCFCKWFGLLNLVWSLNSSVLVQRPCPDIVHARYFWLHWRILWLCQLLAPISTNPINIGFDSMFLSGDCSTVLLRPKQPNLPGRVYDLDGTHDLVCWTELCFLAALHPYVLVLVAVLSFFVTQFPLTSRYLHIDTCQLR